MPTQVSAAGEAISMIRFLLNAQPVTLTDCAPDMTVLDFLRTEAVQRGTKEGCASGDCGACTVVVAEPDGDRLRYSTLNSCITFVASLHGKQLLTVEHLEQQGALHPVQQAMIEQHGSQCGFCTPGFIMSLFALYKNREQLDRAGVERALAGNLCRCTGYRPIIDAALSLSDQPRHDAFSVQETEIAQRLQQMRDDQPGGTLQAGERRFFLPTTTDELAALLQAYPQARLVAGGTDLALEVTQQLRQPQVLIYTGNVPELNRLTDNGSSLSVGAAVSYSRLEPLLARRLPAFARLLERIGSLQVRNQGTLAGNVANASPIGDTPPVLLALNARVDVRSGNRCEAIPIEHFFTGYRETALPAQGFIEQIEIPLEPQRALFIYKVSKRIDDDISAVCAAFSIALDDDGIVRDARLGFGGMAAVPARAPGAEQALIGQPFTEQGIEAARRALGDDFSPIDDVRASGRYRLEVARNLLLRAVLEHSGDYDDQALEVVQYA
jgi:xanthine dehydrogenase small subunit